MAAMTVLSSVRKTEAETIEHLNYYGISDYKLPRKGRALYVASPYAEPVRITKVTSGRNPVYLWEVISF
jgi:hypothetical protein